ncbi:MAG: methyl-accepting chemotaxis protein [Brevinematia bacterium]
MEVYIVGLVVIIFYLIISIYFYSLIKRLKAISNVFIILVRYSIMITTAALVAIVASQNYYFYVFPIWFSFMVFSINYFNRNVINILDLNMIFVFVILIFLDIFFKLNVVLPLSLAYFVIYSTYYFSSKRYDNVFKKIVLYLAILSSLGVILGGVGVIFEIHSIMIITSLLLVAFYSVILYFIVFGSYIITTDSSYNSLTMSLVELDNNLKEINSKISSMMDRFFESVERIKVYKDKIDKNNLEVFIKEFYNIVNEITPQVSFLNNLVIEKKHNMENVLKSIPFFIEDVKSNLKSFSEIQNVLLDINIDITNLTKIALDSEKAVTGVSKSVKDLRLVAKNLSEDLKVFSRISDQSEMLSINISVEASKIGKQSSAFSKLAQQAKKFSDTIMSSVGKIRSLIKELDTKAEFSEYTIKTLVMSFVEIETGLKTLSKKISNILLRVQAISDLATKLESNLVEVNRLSVSMPEFANELGKALDDISWNYKKLKKYSDDLFISLSATNDSIENIIRTVDITFGYVKDLFEK